MEDKLQEKYDMATKKVKTQMNSPKGGSQAEDEFRDAYQKLVQAGLAYQIKRKYRA